MNNIKETSYVRNQQKSVESAEVLEKNRWV